MAEVCAGRERGKDSRKTKRCASKESAVVVTRLPFGRFFNQLVIR